MNTHSTPTQPRAAGEAAQEVQESAFLARDVSTGIQHKVVVFGLAFNLAADNARLTAELATAHGEIETWKGCHDRAVAKEARLTAENKVLREALVAVMQTGAIHGASQAELSIGASALASTNTEDR